MKSVQARPITAAIYSNAVFAGTGYGTQTKQLSARMIADGHNVAVIANYGLEAAQMAYNDIWHYPRGLDAYSNDTAAPNFRDWLRRNPSDRSFMLTLFDTWVFTGPAWDEVPVIGSWVPIDHMPLPPGVQAWCERPNVTPIAMSQFGAAQLERRGIEHLYAPHGIDLGIYKPTPVWSNGEKDMTGRELMQVPADAFTVSIVNANKGQFPPRKAWAENLLAMSIFMSNHPDVWLYVHSEKFGNMQGVALEPLMDAVGIDKSRVAIVNQYALLSGIPDEAMAAIYTATDVLLAPTLGEGFGLTVLEAGATGTPVIVNDFSAQPELVGEGWLTEGQPLWDSAQQSWFRLPLVASIVDSLEQAYRRGNDRSDKQIEHAKQYDADRVYREHWLPIFDVLAP